MNITFIRFHHYKNISSCSFHKHLFPDHSKTFLSCTNIENADKEKVKHRKVLCWNHTEFWIFIQNITFHQLKIWIFCLPHVYILGRKNCEGKIHYMFVSQNNKFDQKYTRDYAEICQVISKQVNSQYFSGCKSISTEEVSILTNCNRPPYLWHSFSLIYLMKVISILALLWHILVFFFNLFLRKKWQLHSWQPCGITRMVARISIFVKEVFI